MVLTNQNGSDVPEIVRNLISDKLFALTPIPWNADAKKEKEKMMETLKKMESKSETDSLQVKNTTPAHPLKDYAGYYSNPAYGDFTIAYEKDTLRAFLGGENIWLKHYHYDVFSIESFKKEESSDSGSKFLINFAGAADGKIESASMQLDEPGKNTVFARSLPKVTLSDNDLAKYAGEYDLEGQIIKIYLKGTTLMVLVPGQPDYETVSVGDDTFDLTIAKGYSVKFTVEDGKSKAITFIQPNGKFTAKRK